MKTLYCFMAFVMATTFALPEPQQTRIDVDIRAPSTEVNCDCQCNNYAWTDEYGKVQGNCKSSDPTKGRWCYTDSYSCKDTKFSKHRTDSYGQKLRWSYEACATPHRNSYECRNRYPSSGGGHKPGRRPGNRPGRRPGSRPGRRPTSGRPSDIDIDIDLGEILNLNERLNNKGNKKNTFTVSQ